MSTQARSGSGLNGCMTAAENGCTMMIVNVVLIIVALFIGYFFWNSWTLAQNGVRATGVVVSLEPHSSNEGGDTYSPVVSYTVNGKAYTFESSSSSDPPEYNVGDQVPILYDPNNPERADLDSFTTSPWLYGGIIGILVIVWLVLNVIFAVRTMRGQSLDMGE